MTKPTAPLAKVEAWGPGGPIQPSHKGRLHDKLGVPQGQPIPVAKIERAAHSPNVTLAREAHFALAARHWHHPK